jgi:hypothetical protein
VNRRRVRTASLRIVLRVFGRSNRPAADRVLTWSER